MSVMFCGTRSFSHVDDDGSWASSPRPKRSKLKKSLSLALDTSRGAKNSANPYSANGLEKFEKLLAELEAKKKQVLQLKRGSSEEDTVRFRYANTDDWIPIVIKRPLPPRPKKEKIKPPAAPAAAAAAAAAQVDGKLEEDAVVDQEGDVHHEDVAEVASRKKKRRILMCWDWSVQSSWAVAIVVVLVCLVFGRAFAVCWATIFWYMAPMMNYYSSHDNYLKKKKKKYGERLGSSNFRVTSGSTSMKVEVKKMSDGRSAGSGIT